MRSEIPVLRATGTGSTTLAAFHAALTAVGLGHYNLIRLSSIVPPGSTVDASGATPVPPGEWGDKLYCVYAEQRTGTPGAQAWAGIGWMHRNDGRGGILVEHEGDTERYVTEAIRSSLDDIAATDPGLYGEPQWLVNGAVCTGVPVCSLVIAPYACEPWAKAPPV